MASATEYLNRARPSVPAPPNSDACSLTRAVFTSATQTALQAAGLGGTPSKLAECPRANLTAL